jgi:hypothetical protein
MTKPAIKGTLFSAVVEDLNRGVDSGSVSHAELEIELSADELALLGEKINAASWYCIHTYHRMVGLLCRAEGGGLEDYWHQRGMRAADRMVDAGIYQQMDYIGRIQSSLESEASARFRALAKDLRLLLSVHASVLNFGDWKTVVDPDHDDRYRVEIKNVDGIPDGIFLAATGMFNRMSALAKSPKPHTWEFERLSPAFVVIRMSGPV